MLWSIENGITFQWVYLHAFDTCEDYHATHFVMFIVTITSLCKTKTFLANPVGASMQAHGPRIPNTKPIPKPEANQYPTPFQKPIVDTNSGGIRIIPIQVDPGYQPRRDANIVFGERYYAKFGINIDVVLLF